MGLVPSRGDREVFERTANRWTPLHDHTLQSVKRQNACHSAPRPSTADRVASNNDFVRHPIGSAFSGAPPIRAWGVPACFSVADRVLERSPTSTLNQPSPIGLLSQLALATAREL